MPSFVNIADRTDADAEDVQQIIDALSGTAGQGIPISITAVNDASNYALDVKNDDPTNSRALRVRTSTGLAMLTADVNGVKASPDGSTASATVVTVTSVQTLTNKTASLLSASSNTQAVPQVKVTHSVTQSIANNSQTALTFDTELYDNDGLHSTTTNPTRLTPSRAGLWLLTGCIEYEANSTGYRDAIIRLNGNNEVGWQRAQNVGPSLAVVAVTTPHPMSTSDYAELVAYQQSGSALLVSSVTARAPIFSMVYLGST